MCSEHDPRDNGPFPLSTLRHSVSHLMASAVQKLYPGAKFGFGPAIEHGFYYDIELPEPVEDKDLRKIEKEMERIAKRTPELVREEVSRTDAKTRLGANGVPIQTPIGLGHQHRGIVDLMTMKGYLFEGEHGEKIKEIEIPEDEIDIAKKYRAIMVEKIAELDDNLMGKYLEGVEPTVPEMKAALRKATIERRCFPVLCGAALRNVGVQILIDSVVEYLPAPTEKPDVQGSDPSDKNVAMSRPHDPDAPFAGLVFKVVSDMHGDLTYVRVYSGRLGKGTRLLNPGNGKMENASRIFEMHAQNRIPLDEVTAGNIVAIVGIKNSFTGDTLCDADKPIILERMHFPEPVIAMAIEPKSQDDKRKLSEALSTIRREDPSFRYSFDDETGQTIIQGMGELHLEIIRNKLIRDMKINVETGKPKVSYREAISKKVEEVRGVHKKQSGGRGQFGDCTISIEPFTAEQAAEAELDFEDNIAFENEIVGGVIPKEFIPSIEYGVRTTAKTGVKFGYQLINAKITLTYGSYHDVDSSQIAFELAGANALKEAVERAGPQLLEPIMKVVVTVPNDYLGNVTGDISSRRGMIVDTEDRDPVKMVSAEIPLSELFGYTTSLRGMSQGRASATMEFLEYRPMPAGMLKELLDEKAGGKGVKK